MNVCSITTLYRWVLVTDEIRNIIKIVVEFHCVSDEIQNILTLSSALESKEWPCYVGHKGKLCIFESYFHLLAKSSAHSKWSWRTTFSLA